MQLSLWKHLRNILAVSCTVCRINSVHSHVGLGLVQPGGRRTIVHTPYLGPISVCKEHERRKSAFCGLCLREAPNFDLGHHMNGEWHSLPFIWIYTDYVTAHSQLLTQMMMAIGCVENEDEETWPNVEATCKSCRTEWLWRRVYNNPLDREAIGGPPLPPSPQQPTFHPIPSLQTLLQNVQDWETKHTLEGFIEMAEGTISDLLTLAREKWWLRKYTKIGDMMQQALAARRWVNGGGESATDPRIVEQRDPPPHQQHPVQYDVELANFSPTSASKDDESLDLAWTDDEDEKERAQLAMDLELATQLEAEEREKNGGEYGVDTQALAFFKIEEQNKLRNQQYLRRARTPSPPARRTPVQLQPQAQYDTPVQIQFAPENYADLERFDDHEILSQELSHSHDFSEEEEEEEEEEEDASVMQTEENSVKELALGDWARARILDGYWVSPADVWYGLDRAYKGSGMGVDQVYSDLGSDGDEQGRKGDRRKDGWTLAVHPCPWTIEGSDAREGKSRGRSGTDASSSSLGPSSDPTEFGMDVKSEEEESHPRWETVVANGPPTYALCEQAFTAHQKQIRAILLPAMRNIVRKLIMECGVALLPGEDGTYGPIQRRDSVSSSGSSSGGSPNRKRKRSGGRKVKRVLKDPAIIASKMPLEEVVRILREEEGVWFDGVDWIERMRNNRERGDRGVPKRKRNLDAEEPTQGRSMEQDVDGALGAGVGGPPPKKKRKTSQSSDGGSLFDDRRNSTLMPLPGSTSSSASSEEDGISSGSGTSPVLSTTTLQTTPSPPPIVDELMEGTQKSKGKRKRYHDCNDDADVAADVEDEGEGDDEDFEEEEEEEEDTRVRIPVAPILERPKLLHPIPYIPLTLEGMAGYTISAVRMVSLHTTHTLSIR